MGVKHKLSQFAYWTKENIKAIDSFPNEIMLSYKGDSTFKSLLGGWVSLVIKLILLTYGISLFIILVRRKGTLQSKNSVFTDLTKQKETYSIDRTNFGLTFELLGENLESFYDETYFKVEITQHILSKPFLILSFRVVNFQKLILITILTIRISFGYLRKLF